QEAAAETSPAERHAETGTTVESPREASAQALGPSLMVGREAEMQQLQEWLAQALAGHRQMVVVTGEAGVGKATLVEALVERAVLPRSCWLGQGQCIEHFGAGEAYLPLLSALGQVARAPGATRFQTLLGQYAPSWLTQMPALLSVTEQEALQRR